MLPDNLWLHLLLPSSPNALPSSLPSLPPTPTLPPAPTFSPNATSSTPAAVAPTPTTLPADPTLPAPTPSHRMQHSCHHEQDLLSCYKRLQRQF